MENKKYFYQGLTVLMCVSIIVLGWVYFVSGTTIGTDISTINFLATGTSTLATTTIGTNFYIDEAGNASTTGVVLFGSTLDVTGVSTLSGGIVNTGTTTLATTTIGTNFYIDEAGNASTTGYLFRADASTTGTLIVGGESNLSTLVYGGATTTIATTGAANAQMTAAQFCDNSLLYFEEESASSTIIWLPNASQLIGDCIPDVGDTKSTYLINITDDTASTTLTASTSINLKMSNEADAILNSLTNFGVENDNAWVRCTNMNGTEVDCFFNTIFPAD